MAATLPAVGRPRAPRVPSVSERTLASGARAVAVRRRGVPLVEARLRIPVAGARAAGNGARQRLAAAALLAGTGSRRAEELAADLQRLGASLGASVGLDWLTLSGSTLASNLGPFLALAGEVLTDAAFPPEEVAVHKARLVQELTMVHSQPAALAGQALRRRLYGRHPYGSPIPRPEEVAGLSPSSLRRWLTERATPAGSILVLVGDIRPDAALDAAEEALAAWRPGGSHPGVPEPAPPGPGPVVVVDRPGAVQTNIRLGGPSLSRGDPGYPGLSVANLVFGGYASSRLFDNIRERRGYTYSPRSGIEHHRAVSQLGVGADVATEVTAPALVEIRYELARLVSSAVTQAELDDARRYLPGTLALAVQTQAGLASHLTALLSAGLGVEHLRDFPRAVGRVESEAVLAAAQAWFSPRRLVTVLVGDAEAVVPGLEALDQVEVQ